MWKEPGPHHFWAPGGIPVLRLSGWYNDLDISAGNCGILCALRDKINFSGGRETALQTVKRCRKKQLNEKVRDPKEQMRLLSVTALSNPAKTTRSPWRWHILEGSPGERLYVETREAEGN